jgi:hypothetical protein
VFDTAAVKTGTLTTFSCGTIVPTPTAGHVACTGPSGGSNITAGSTTAGVTITLSSATAMNTQKSNGLYEASFLGIPILALVGWFASRRSPRRNFFRIVGLLLLALGLSYVTACGGSFTRPTPPPATGVTPGSYLVQVKASDGTNSYYAIVPLVVNGN